jgi:4-amino-4-deoxy-L-arabinose transferase-like glycosyltransferase
MLPFPQSRWADRAPILVVSLITAGAAALRFHQLDHWSLWLDEGIQYYEASQPLAQLYATLFPQEMPAFFIVGHAFIRLGLDSPWWLRALPAALGAATIPLVYLLGRELFGRPAGLWAALLAALHPVLVIYSQEYRFYGLLIFLSCLNGYAIAVAVRTNLAGWWALFCASAILNLYTHHVAALAIFGLGTYAAAAIVGMATRDPWSARQTVFSAAAAAGVITAAYLPAVPMLLNSLTADAAAGLSSKDPLLLALRIVFIDHSHLGPVTAVTLLALAVIGTAASLTRAPHGAAFIIGAAMPLAVLLSVGSGRVTSSARYTTFLMPVYCAAAGAGVAFIVSALDRFVPWRSLTRVTVALVLIVAAGPALYRVYSENPKEQTIDTKAGFDFLTQHTAADDVVLEGCAQCGGSVYHFRYWSYYWDLLYRLDPTRTKPTMPRVPIDEHVFRGELPRVVNATGKLWVALVSKDERLLEQRSSYNFRTTCFRQFCVLESRRPSDPMKSQIAAFFGNYLDLGEASWAVAAKAVSELPNRR